MYSVRVSFQLLLYRGGDSDSTWMRTFILIVG